MSGGPPGWPEAMLLDLDGTLVDSLDDIAWALNVARAEFGYETASRETVRGWVGDGAARAIARSLGIADEHDPRVVAVLGRYLVIYGSGAGPGSPLFPGAADLLAELRSRGVRLACTTNKPAVSTGTVLRAAGIDGAFEAVVTPDSLGGVRKPEPGFFAEALRRLGGVAPARALVVGDGVPDVRGARASGIPVVAILGGYGDRAALLAAGPDYAVEALADLRPLLDGGVSLGRS